MKAMIFAAGLGSRLKPLTDTRPKALITVGGKTMLEHIILKLKAAGFDEIVINVHHFSNQILAFLEANQNFGIDIQISDETDCLLDTGGGLERAYYLLHHPEDMFTKEGETPYELIFENLMKGMDEEEIIERGLGIMRKECYLLHNVDILSNCDFESLMYYHQNSSNINATLLVSPRKTSRYLLFNDDNLLRGWVNKDTMETKPAGLRYKEGEYREYAYSGIQVTTPKILYLLPRRPFSTFHYPNPPPSVQSDPVICVTTIFVPSMLTSRSNSCSVFSSSPTASLRKNSWRSISFIIRSSPR